MGDQYEKAPRRAVKKPTPYNDFMKREMAAIKEADPTLPHKEIFKLAAARVCTLLHACNLELQPTRCSFIRLFLIFSSWITIVEGGS